MAKALSGELSCPCDRSCLARLYKSIESLCCHPDALTFVMAWALASCFTLKGYTTKFFLHDWQGTVRQAILYADKSC